MIWLTSDEEENSLWAFICRFSTVRCYTIQRKTSNEAVQKTFGKKTEPSKCSHNLPMLGLDLRRKRNTQSYCIFDFDKPRFELFPYLHDGTSMDQTQSIA